MSRWRLGPRPMRLIASYRLPADSSDLLFAFDSSPVAFASRDPASPPDPSLAASRSWRRARESGARVLLEPREGPAGWRSVVAAPHGGEIAFWQSKGWAPGR